MARHQVFISSTYRDLRAERSRVVQAVLALQCFPAGMELFPAASESAWQHIQRVISESDYYVLVVGARYGSVDAEGVSFTEREYEYARSLGIPILAFLHSRPERLVGEKSERSAEGLIRLAAFKKTLEANHTCVYWSSAAELARMVSTSLTHAMSSTPRPGWERVTSQPTSNLASGDAALEALTSLICGDHEIELNRCSPEAIDVACEPASLYDYSSYQMHIQTTRAVSEEPFEPDDCVTEMRAFITCEPMDSSGRRSLAGIASFSLVLAADAYYEQSWSFFDVCDSHSQYLTDLHADLFLDEDEFQRAVKLDVLPPWNFMVLTSVQLLPIHRGRRTGLLVAKHLVDTFASDLDFVVIDARPDVGSGLRTSATPWFDALGLDRFPGNERDALLRLRRYFARLGGVRFKRTNYLVMDMTRQHPSLRKVSSG